MSNQLFLIILPTLMIIAAASDVTSYKIPNWLTGLTALAFFPSALASGMSMQELSYHLLSGVIMFVVGYGLFIFRLFGGGDAKLMAAAGLWFGTSQTMPFLVLTVFAGFFLTLGVVGWSAFNMWAEMKDLTLSKKISQIRPKVPYGFALAVGAILALPGSWMMPAAT
jgi:prepilin peptidase CpaA